MLIRSDTQTIRTSCENGHEVVVDLVGLVARSIVPGRGRWPDAVESVTVLSGVQQTWAGHLAWECPIPGCGTDGTFERVA